MITTQEDNAFTIASLACLFVRTQLSERKRVELKSDPDRTRYTCPSALIEVNISNELEFALSYREIPV